MIALFFFLFDFIVHVACDQWFSNSLLVYFMYRNLQEEALWKPWQCMVLLLLQDFFLHGRFGLGLICFIPLLLVIKGVKVVVHKYWWMVVGYLLLPWFIILEMLVIKNWLFMQNIGVKSTLEPIFGTIILMSTLIFFGTLGNRFLSVLDKKRKVWTPNRKDAL